MENDHLCANESTRFTNDVTQSDTEMTDWNDWAGCGVDHEDYSDQDSNFTRPIPHNESFMISTIDGFEQSFDCILVQAKKRGEDDQKFQSLVR